MLVYSVDGCSGQGWGSQKTDASLGLPCGWQRPQHLGFLPLLPQAVSGAGNVAGICMGSGAAVTQAAPLPMPASQAMV